MVALERQCTLVIARPERAAGPAAESFYILQYFGDRHPHYFCPNQHVAYRYQLGNFRHFSTASCAWFEFVRCQATDFLGERITFLVILFSNTIIVGKCLILVEISKKIQKCVKSRKIESSPNITSQRTYVPIFTQNRAKNKLRNIGEESNFCLDSDVINVVITFLVNCTQLPTKLCLIFQQICVQT